MKILRKSFIRSLILVAMLLGLLGSPQSAAATGLIQVTVLFDDYGGDPNTCSLREAIISANYDFAFGGCAAGDGEDAIILAPGVYTLSLGVGDYLADAQDQSGILGDLDIYSSMVIVGAGVSQTIIQPYPGLATKTRIFHLSGVKTSVTMQDLTIQGGYAFNDTPDPKYPPVETLGGGIYNEYGRLTLSRVHVVGNYAHHSGGGVYSDRMDVSNYLYIIDSTIEANVAELADGGGIVNESGMVVAKSLIRGNISVGGNGGGVYNNNFGRLTSVTIAENKTLAPTGRGAALYADNVIELLNSTIARNISAALTRYGIEISAGRGVMMNNIIAYNQASVNGVYAPANCWFDIKPVGAYNLHEVEPDFCLGESSPNFILAKSNLNLSETLEYNQGRTKSYALLPLSAAIDAGHPQNLFRHPVTGIPYPCSGGDQRWALRPVDGDGNSTAICDVGAVEAPHPTLGLTFFRTLYLPQISR